MQIPCRVQIIYMKHLGLFEGIGGFSLAAQWAGWETIAWCEIDAFCQKVLKHHFPNSIGHENIKETDFTKYYGTIDIITGGFPCQPFSLAGKRKGTADSRHLWPEMLRAIREVKPRWVVGENVFGIINWDGGLVFEQVQIDLENEGYEVQAYILPAASINAPHKRERVWFIAHSDRERNDNCKNTTADNIQRKQSENNKQSRNRRTGKTTRYGSIGVATNPDSARQQTRKEGQEQISPRRDLFRKPLSTNWSSFPTQPPVCSGDDGLPTQLDGITFPKWRNESIKTYGNAIVPQVAYQIFTAINQYERTKRR